MMTDEPQAHFSDGAAYERLMGRWSKLVGAQFIAWLDAPQGLNWLDAGCGNGAFTEEVIARCAPAAITGIDPSPGQIAYANTRPGTAQAEFHLGDAQNLPFANGRFDIAVMALVIAFIPNPAKALAELKRVVKPGGRIAAYIWDLPGGGLPHNAVHGGLKSLGLNPPVPPSSAISRRDALEGLWRDAGLRDVETEVIRIRPTYADFEDYWQSSTQISGPTGAIFKALTPEQRDELRRRLRERLPAEADGRIVLNSFANAVKGRLPG